MHAHPAGQPIPADAEPRRPLTILFVDLSDSTALAAAMEAEDYAAMQEDVRSAFRSVVTERGGLVNQFQGDGLQAVFGYPQATEVDGCRATEAALEVHARVRALSERYQQAGAGRLSVHSGIHAGVMLVRAGADAAAKLELFGPTPGLAKHLSDIAEADEILVSEETLGPLGQFFDTGARRLVTLKGREAPLPVVHILARTSVRTRYEAHARRGLLPFIGRRAELGRLEQVLGDVATRRCTRFVAIAAAPGVGKTRLAEEFLGSDTVGQASVWRGYCESGLSAEPLQPFVQMLRARFRLPGANVPAPAWVEHELASIDSGLLDLLPDLLQVLSIAPEAGAEALPASAERTIAAVCRLFACLARQRPQILFIDDWQWADDASRQVARGLQELSGLPILLLASTRPLDVSAAQLAAADILTLEPFNDVEADATIGRLMPHADPFVAAEIRRHSGGNALFIEELCHSVTGAGPTSVQGGPAWLETLIASRVSRLPRDQRDVLFAAAVVGNVVPAGLLRGLTGDAQETLVRGLARQDLLFPGEDGGTLRFKHGITRDVVYAAIGLEQRRDLHRRAAALIAARAEAGAEIENCETLAYHHAGAGDAAPAARYAEMAGDKAMASSSIDRAKTQYRSALQMIDRLPPSPRTYHAWRSILRRLGLASVFDPAREDLAIFRQAVSRAQEADDTAGLAYAEYWLAYVDYAIGDAREAVAHGKLALKAAENLGDARLVSQVRALLGQALAAAGQYTGAQPLLVDAAQLRRTLRPDQRPPPGLAYSMACQATMLGDLGRFEASRLAFDEALSVLPVRGHEVEGSVLCLRAGMWLWQGRFEAAREDALAAQRIAERVRSLYLYAMSRSLGAYAAWRLDPQPQRLADLRDATSWLSARDKQLFISLNHGWLAEALAAHGHEREARSHAALALARVRRRDSFGAAMAMRAMARLAAARQDWRAAQRCLDRADRVAESRGSPHEEAANLRCRAEVALALGERAVARSWLERAAVACEALQLPAELEAIRRLQLAIARSSAAAPAATVAARG